MRARRKGGREEGSPGESMRDPGDAVAEGVAYSAAASAPPAPGGIAGDREVGIGQPFDPLAADDAMMATSADPLDPYLPAAEQTTRQPGVARSRSGAQTAIPDAVNPLRSDDGRVV